MLEVVPGAVTPNIYQSPYAANRPGFKHPGIAAEAKRPAQHGDIARDGRPIPTEPRAMRVAKVLVERTKQHIAVHAPILSAHNHSRGVLRQRNNFSGAGGGRAAFLHDQAAANVNMQQGNMSFNAQHRTGNAADLFLQPLPLLQNADQCPAYLRGEWMTYQNPAPMLASQNLQNSHHNYFGVPTTALARIPPPLPSLGDFRPSAAYNKDFHTASSAPAFATSQLPAQVHNQVENSSSAPWGRYYNVQSAWQTSQNLSQLPTGRAQPAQPAQLNDRTRISHILHRHEDIPEIIVSESAGQRSEGEMSGYNISCAGGSFPTVGHPEQFNWRYTKSEDLTWEDDEGGVNNGGGAYFGLPANPEPRAHSDIQGVHRQI
jgi:hypothetical protein